MADEATFADELRGPEPQKIAVAVAFGAAATAIIAILLAKSVRK